MTSTRFLSIAILLACSLCALVTIALGQGAKERSAQALEFSGKILVISCRVDSETGGVLEKFTVKNVGGEPFLVGSGVDDGSAGNWHSGRPVWIALADISQIVEFPDLDAYKSSIKDRGL